MGGMGTQSGGDRVVGMGTKGQGWGQGGGIGGEGDTEWRRWGCGHKGTKGQRDRDGDEVGLGAWGWGHRMEGTVLWAQGGRDGDKEQGGGIGGYGDTVEGMELWAQGDKGTGMGTRRWD